MSSSEPNKKRNIQKTKPYKVQNARKSKKNSSKKPQVKKIKDGKNNKGKHPKLMLTLKIIVVIFLLLCVIGAGIVAGVFFGLFGDEFEITKEELKIGASNSVIVDQNGNVIANLSGDEKRKVISLEEMADYLPKAYIAIEDERYYKHSGVDFKRTAGAILKTILGNSSYGGSTITQQLVKNITKDDEASGIAGIMRKVREWAKAYQVERMISKDQILELYLNILFVGTGNLHGVELGAEYYFNKSAKDLDLAECAFMAGINSSPNYYNPYELLVQGDTVEKRDERIKNKTLTVLAKMKELGYIENDDDYNSAVAKVESGLKFEKATISTGNIYSYHTDAVVDQVIKQVMDEKGISEELARNYVYSSGLTIYSTVNTSIQSRMEEEYAKGKYIVKGTAKDTNGNLKNDHSQSAMAMIDYKTGNVVAIVGGLGTKTESRGLNRATQSVRQCGSSMKPLATIAPGLQEKVITAATVYDDSATKWGSNYTPKNYNGFKGLINIRSFIATSQNIPALKIMSELTPKKSIEYLNKMGINSIKQEEDNDITLALGGTRNGATPLEMAAAYGTIANDGVYITPTFYTKVTDSSGNTVLIPNQETRRVISEQNAYITKTIVQEPVKSGTATYCAISGMDVAAKTGTTDDDYDRWLCGFTPYYSAACWYGYDTNETVRFGSSNPSGLIWDAVMTDTHKNLANARFTKPNGIVEATVCKITGCLATTGCTSTYKEIFTSDNMPTKCEGHGTQKICKESQKLANEYCPDVEEKNYGGVIPKEKLKLWIPLNRKGEVGEKITETCTIHKKPEEPKKPDTNTTNNVNTTNKNNTINKNNTTNKDNTTNKNNTAGNNNTSDRNNTNTNSENKNNTSNTN